MTDIIPNNVFLNPPAINPDELDGEQFFVDSFFDVFFDITVTDVDDRFGWDYAGQPDGASLATHSVGDENREFIMLPDGTVIDQFDSAAFLEGTVVDESTDPPFTIGFIDPNTGLPDPNTFGGPTTATSTLLNPVARQVIPEPTTVALLGIGLAGLAGTVVRRRLKKTKT